MDLNVRWKNQCNIKKNRFEKLELNGNVEVESMSYRGDWLYVVAESIVGDLDHMQYASFFTQLYKIII